MQTVQITVTLTIKAAVKPLVANPTTVTLPDEIVGQGVDKQAVSSLSGGVGPFAVAIDPNSPAPLPPGLSLAVDDSGAVTLSGTPTADGTGTFVIAASDSSPS